MPNSLDTVDPSSYGPIFNITIEKGDVVLAAADKAGHKVTRVYGYNDALTSDHRFKQCIDFMHYGDTAMRDWLVEYLRDNYVALGIMGLISNGRCMGFPSQEKNQVDREVYWNGPENSWRNYTGYDQHTDHVHVQFNTNPIKGQPAPAKPAKTHKLDVVEYCKVAGVKSYNANGTVDSIRPKGYKVTGYWVERSDGRYLRTAWDHDYPSDDLVPTKPAVSKIQDAVSLTALQAAARKDPKRPQGGQSPDAVDDVRMVEAALQAEGLLDPKYAHDGSFGSSTVAAYAAWQRKLGYHGKDADGIPGKASLDALGKKYDFATTNHD